MKKSGCRKLTDTSYLAMSIKDRMDIESLANGISYRWKNLLTLLLIVREADNAENENIYYQNTNGKREIIIRKIEGMPEEGTDYTTEGMRNKLTGLQESVRDEYGNYILSVLTTHDLNSARINDLQELLIRI